jgi:hypothetical protein
VCGALENDIRIEACQPKYVNILNKVVLDDCLLDARFYFGVSISKFFLRGGRGRAEFVIK